MKLWCPRRLKEWLAAERPWRTIRQTLGLDKLSPLARRIVVGIAGACLLAAGVAMIVLPGPAFVVIPLALAVLAIEFAWARQLFRKAQRFLKRATS